MLSDDAVKYAGFCFFLAVWIVVRLIGGPTSGSADSDSGDWGGSDCGGDASCD